MFALCDGSDVWCQRLSDEYCSGRIVGPKWDREAARGVPPTRAFWSVLSRWESNGWLCVVLSSAIASIGKRIRTHVLAECSRYVLGWCALLWSESRASC